MIADSFGVLQNPVRRLSHRSRDSFTFTRRFQDFSATGSRFNHFHFHREPLAPPFYPPLRQSKLVMSETTVEIEDETDRWRYTCPRGHTRWEPTNHHFWCATCARSESVDGSFHELRDSKTGRLFERENVQLLTRTGPYDPELDGRAD